MGPHSTDGVDEGVY